MNAITTTALALGLLAIASPAADTKMTLKDDKDKVSYSIGLNIGRNMKQEGLDINPDALAAAMKDVFAGAKPQLTDEEVQQVMQDFQKKMMAKQMAVREEGLAKNKVEGEKFLADNKKKEGIKTTASGLQYKVIKDGTGKTPKASDTVKTHYRGTLINGTEFDSSYKRGEPAEFPVNGVIKGWTEALQLMKEGAKWQLFIPSELAYGERGAGKDIGPNSTLIFDIELLSVKAGQ
jgi:FKBP-type peptidyl-prolyl cis-trans isomerase FklB